MKKLEIIGKIMLPILLIVLVGLIFVKGKEQDEQQKLLSEEIKYITSVKKDITEKEEEIQQLKENRERKINKKASITLCIDQMTPNLYDQVKPIFDSYGLTGVFVIKNGILPGSKDSITKEQYDRMLQDGWDVAVGGWDDLNLEREEDLEIWEERLNKLIDQMDEQKLKVPIYYYFEESTYTDRCDDILQDCGFRVICHYGDESTFYGLDWNKEWNLIGVYRVSQSNYEIEELMSKLQDHKAAIILSTRYIGTVQNNNLDCTTASYRTVLESIQALKEEGIAEVFSLSELYNTRLQTYIDADKQDNTYKEELNKKQTELQELEKEWESIFKQEKKMTEPSNTTEEDTVEQTLETDTKKESEKDTLKESETKEKETIDAKFSFDKS